MKRKNNPGRDVEYSSALTWRDLVCWRTQREEVEPSTGSNSIEYVIIFILPEVLWVSVLHRSMVECTDMRLHLASWNQVRSHHKSSSKVGILTKASLSQYVSQSLSRASPLLCSLHQCPTWWDSEEQTCEWHLPQYKEIYLPECLTDSLHAGKSYSLHPTCREALHAVPPTALNRQNSLRSLEARLLLDSFLFVQNLSIIRGQQTCKGPDS